MKALPTGVSPDRKRLIAYCSVLALVVVVYFWSRSWGDSSPQAASSTPSIARPAGIAGSNSAAASLTPMPPQRAMVNRRGEAPVQEVKLSMKPAEGADLSKIDPTIKLELLARLQKLPLEGGERNLFDFGAAPAPLKPPPAVAPIKPAAPAVAVDATPEAPLKPVTPPPPPIPLKFYGFVNGSVGSSRTAFFLEGDEIYVAGENDLVHNRYKIIRIGVNSAVVEDTTNKNQQTLPLVEELPG